MSSSVFSFGRKHQRSASQTSGESITEDARRPISSTVASTEATKDLQSGDLGFSTADSAGVLLRRKSRLAKTLADTLNSSSALPYFLQFMEARRVDHLLKFWLAAEIFRVSSANRESLPSQSNTPKSCRKDEEDKNSDKNKSNNRPEECQKRSPMNHFSASKNLCNGESSDRLPHQTPNGFCGGAQKSSRSELLEKTILEDAKSIYIKFVAQDAQFPVGVTNRIRNEVVDRLCGESGNVDPACFCSAQNFVFRIMEERYFPEFCKSVYHNYHQIDVLTSGTVYLSDIIYDTNALLSFNEFLELEGALSYIQFLLCAENFSEDLRRQINNETYSFDSVVEDAMSIYIRYISMRASCPLGFRDEVRLEVENSISREGGPLPDCFDVPAKLIWRLLEERYLPKYLESDGFNRYLTELRSAIKNHIELPPVSGIARRKTTAGSDISSSEISTHSCPVEGNRLSSRSKNWSMGDSRALKLQTQVQNVSAEEVRLDAKRSSDPDSLWKRGSQSSLLLGRVDSLGQYVRQFEDEPLHKAKGSKISSAVKNLVKSKPNKDKEEEARRIAESIVAGITNLNSNNAEFDSDDLNF